MDRRPTVTLARALPLFLGLALSVTSAIGQPAEPNLRRYLVRAVLTSEGLKNFRTQPPTALKAGVAKFLDSVGGRLEAWYFDYSEATAYSIIYFPTEIAAATAQLMTNSSGFARVTLHPLISAEEADKALALLPAIRVPQQQQQQQQQQQ